MPFNVLDQPATSEPSKGVEMRVCCFLKRQDGWKSNQTEKDLSHAGDKARQRMTQVAE